MAEVAWSQRVAKYSQAPLPLWQVCVEDKDSDNGERCQYQKMGGECLTVSYAKTLVLHKQRAMRIYLQPELQQEKTIAPQIDQVQWSG